MATPTRPKIIKLGPDFDGDTLPTRYPITNNRKNWVIPSILRRCDQISQFPGIRYYIAFSDNTEWEFDDKGNIIRMRMYNGSEYKLINNKVVSESHECPKNIRNNVLRGSSVEYSQREYFESGKIKYTKEFNSGNENYYNESGNLIRSHNAFFDVTEVYKYGCNNGSRPTFIHRICNGRVCDVYLYYSNEGLDEGLLESTVDSNKCICKYKDNMVIEYIIDNPINGNTATFEWITTTDIINDLPRTFPKLTYVRIDGHEENF